MSRSDWQVYATRALREGKTLKEASAEWKRANERVFSNPTSPESRYHHHRRKALGGLLSKGFNFREAQRMLDRAFDRYQGAQRSVERSIVHPTRSNPRGGNNLILMGAIGLAAWYALSRGGVRLGQ